MPDKQNQVDLLWEIRSIRLRRQQNLKRAVVIAASALAVAILIVSVYIIAF